MKKTNIHFFIFFLIACSVLVADYFVYFFKFDFLITSIFVLVVNSIISGIFIKKKVFKIKSDFSKFDFIFIFILLGYLSISIVFPDLSWDTRSYHIYIQENTFADKINFDFFAGRNLNSFLFPLGDRVNYLFRIILGYRLGTLMSYYLILILYYQIKNYLKKLTKSSNELFIAISSIFPCLMSIIFSFAGTYYIDNFSLICLMEIFYIILFEDNFFESKSNLYILASIIGISISIKMTSIVFIIPLFIFFIIKNAKKILKVNFLNYIISVILFIIPFGVYVFDNYIQTGNPVFPYYNNIFKSEYFMISEWKDSNFGPENIIQFLFWPIYIIFYPNRAFDTKFVDWIWGIGFVFDILYIINSFIKKNIKDNKVYILSVILFFTYYLWEKFVIGYVRYATILLILSWILIIYCIYKQYMIKKWISIVLAIGIFILSLPSCGYDFLVKVKDFENVNNYFSEYCENIKLLFIDRTNKKIQDDEIILGAIGDDSMIPTLLRNQNRIYNLEEWVTITNEKTNKMYDEKILNKNIYVYCDEFSLERKKKYLEINGFEILNEEIVSEESVFLSATNKIHLLIVKKELNNVKIQ